MSFHMPVDHLIQKLKYLALSENGDVLHDALHHFHIAVEQAPVAIAITDEQGRFLYVNRQFLRITGFDEAELLGNTPSMITSGETPAEVYDELWSTLRAGKVWRGELLNRNKHGEPYWEAETITPVTNAEGEVVSFVVVKEDITQRKQYESELKLMATVFETGQAALITDRSMRIERVNQAFTAITGYLPGEVIGKTPRIFKSDKHQPDFYRALWARLVSQGHWQGEIWNRNKSGEIYPVFQSITAVRDEAGDIRNFVSVFHSIIERKRLEDDLEDQASRDHLTGAANRRAFEKSLSMEFEGAFGAGVTFALLIFDIDHFKRFNDTYGHDAGDQVLVSLVAFIHERLRTADLLARWGGEEFVVLLRDTSLEGARAMSQRLVEQVACARIAGRSVTISAGLSAFQDGDTPATLLARADEALYRAKRAGRNRLCTG